MKVLVVTKETQKQRENDFSWTDEGELVTFASECDGEAVDGVCGCRRAMSGLTSHKATTTMKVVEQNITANDLEIALRASYIQAGWGTGKVTVEMAKEDAQELIRLAAAFPIGTVIEKRGSKFKTRIV